MSRCKTPASKRRRPRREGECAEQRELLQLARRRPRREGEWLTLPEAAAYTKIHRQTLRVLLLSGEIPYSRKTARPRSPYLIERDHLDSYLARVSDDCRAAAEGGA